MSGMVREVFGKLIRIHTIGKNGGFMMANTEYKLRLSEKFIPLLSKITGDTIDKKYS